MSTSMSKTFPRTIVLFDVDGTLTLPRQRISTEMELFLERLKVKVDIGLVGGSDLAKIAEQMDCNDSKKTSEQQIQNLIDEYDYIFAENGLISYHHGELICKRNIINKLGEQRIQKLINFVLAYFSRLTLPVKRGNFIEFRNGLINISPIGRSCSQEERNEFFEYDQKHGIRKKLVQALRDEFDSTDMEMDFVIGGQISIDCYPKGWDKRFCLQFIHTHYDKIYFFGDRVEPGGNDYGIFHDPTTIGYHVRSPEDTKNILTELFF